MYRLLVPQVMSPVEVSKLGRLRENAATEGKNGPGKQTRKWESRICEQKKPIDILYTVVS